MPTDPKPLTVDADAFRDATLGKGLRPRCLHRLVQLPPERRPYRYVCVKCGSELKARSTKPPTVEEVREWLALAEKATPAPWKTNEWYGTEDGGWCAVGPHHEGDDRDAEEGNPPDGDAHEKAKRDAAFIAAARSALPTLCEAYLRLVRAARVILAGYDAADAPPYPQIPESLNVTEEWNALRDAPPRRRPAGGEVKRPLAKCVNGCDASPQPPSKVLCVKCLRVLDEKMRGLLRVLRSDDPQEER